MFFIKTPEQSVESWNWTHLARHWERHAWVRQVAPGAKCGVRQVAPGATGGVRKSFWDLVEDYACSSWCDLTDSACRSQCYLAESTKSVHSQLSTDFLHMQVPFFKNSVRLTRIFRMDRNIPKLVTQLFMIFIQTGDFGISKLESLCNFCFDVLSVQVQLFDSNNITVSLDHKYFFITS